MSLLTAHPPHLYPSPALQRQFRGVRTPIFADKTGMHLHGINDCSGHFRIQPPAFLDAFAREWGFIPAPSLELPSVHQGKSFTEEVRRIEKWNSEVLEGFVVRPSRPPMQPHSTMPR